MKRDEFLRQLEELLSDISAEERADAMDFYRSYFEDAGEGNEASILQELESPQKVAEVIKRDLGFVSTQEQKVSEDTKQEAGENHSSTAGTNQTYTNAASGNANTQNAYWNPNANHDAEYYQNVNNTIHNLQKENKKSNTGEIVVGVVIAVLTCPVWLSILAVIIAFIFSVVAVLVSAAFGVAAVMLGLMITGFVMVGCGIGFLFSGSPIIGLGVTGGGLLVLALGLLTIVLTVWIFGAFLPWAFKGIYHLCRMPFEKRKERAAV